MALEFDWDLWSGAGDVVPPRLAGEPRIVREGKEILYIAAAGYWLDDEMRELYWLCIYGPEEELDALDEGTVIDLVRVRYGAGI
jgi:hypothetical protein